MPKNKIGDILTLIRRQQEHDFPPDDTLPPEHKPEMLLIGCIDARLNIKSDIGIPDGKALVHRNIAALVRRKPDPADNEGSSVAASLEFAVNIMRVRHIVVMGHTDCGGIRACLDGGHDEETVGIRQYLSPLAKARSEIIAQGGGTQAQARAMEEAAVRQSLANLKEYEVLQQAVREGRLTLHGWVINTATKRIMEMGEDGKFKPMWQGDGA